MSGATNRVVIEGVVVDIPGERYSPAGIPILRFVLEHDSEQVENGVARAIRLRVGVRLTGEPGAAVRRALVAGAMLRVSGHLARPRLHEGDPRLIICASEVTPLAMEPNI